MIVLLLLLSALRTSNEQADEGILFLSMAFALSFYAGIPHSVMDTWRYMEDLEGGWSIA